MANTVIQIKNSGVSGNVPQSLKPGELAINYVDGKLFYGDQSNNSVLFDVITEPSGLNGELQFNDNGSFGASDALSFNSSTKTLSANNILVNGLNVKATLVSSYNQANTANANALIADNKATYAGLHANAAYEYANSITSNVNVDYWARERVNSAYLQANTSTDYSNVVGSYANSAYLHANSAYVSQNTTGGYANAAFTQANTAATNSLSAGSYANGAFNFANTSNAYFYGVNATQNTNITTATNNAAAASSYANGAFIRANTADQRAVTSGVYANAAFQQSNAHNTFANNSYYLKTGGTISGNVEITGNLSVSGNLFVSGNVTAINANNLTLKDSIIYLAEDNPANTVDIGIVGSFTENIYQHTGIIRDSTDGTWKFFSNVVTEPGTTIDFNGTEFYDSVKLGNLQSNNTNVVANNSLDAITVSQFGNGNSLYIANTSPGGTSHFVVKSNGKIAIGGTETPATLTLNGKLLAGDSISNANLNNILDFSSTSGINAYRPINLIDSSGTIKVARIDDNILNSTSIELQRWNSAMSNNMCYWDVYADIGGFGIRDRTTAKNRIFIDNEGRVLLGSPSGNSTLSLQSVAKEANLNLQVIGSGYISQNLSIGNSNSINRFEVSGNTGQLFSVTDSMTGTIFSVNDISGIPSIEVLDTGLVKIAQYSGNVLIGTGTDNGTDKLQVNGSILGTTIKGNTIISTVATGTAPLTVTSTTLVANLNSDLHDGMHAVSTNTATSIVSRDSSGNFSAGTITATLSGTSTAATNIVGGSAGTIPYQTAANTTAMIAAGTAGYFLKSNNTSAPSWVELSLTDLPDAWVKKAVKVATTANIALSGTQTIDGIAVVAGDRVLVKDQTTSSQNGIYIVASGSWTRASDANTSSKISGGQVSVDQGTSNGGTAWDTDFKSTDTLGTTNMLWYLTIDSGRLITSGSTVTPAAVLYNGTTAAAGRFDGGTTTPTGTTRLNYGGYFYPSYINLVGSTDTATAATHYFVETGSDGFVRPKTLANVRSEIGAITAGDVTVGPLRYNGTTSTAGQFDGGTTTPASTTRLNYNGNFYVTNLFAASKSFLIPHPTKTGKKLRYGSLEGPENGVYVRGKLKNSNTIKLPDYWSNLVDTDSITVNLTPIGKHQKLFVENIIDNTIIINNDKLFDDEINCFYTVYAERIDVEKLQVEID